MLVCDTFRAMWPALCLLALLGVLALPGAADAQAPIDEHPRIEHLRPIAERHFASVHERCAGDVRIVAGGLKGAGRRGTKAWAEAWDRRHTRADHCEVRLRGDWHRWGRADLCIVLTHEWGHLAGRDHVDEPGDVMYHDLPRTASVPTCARLLAWERGAWMRRHVLAASRASVRRSYALARRSTAGRRRHALAHAGHLRWRHARIAAELRELRRRLGP